MCETKPGLRCASDTRENATETTAAYTCAFPDGPAVDPVSSATCQFSSPEPAEDEVPSSMSRTDHLAATTSDEATQLRIAQDGDTAQREMIQQNPNLTVGTIEWIVDNWTFNPRAIAEFGALPNMTDELRARIRPWGMPDWW